MKRSFTAALILALPLASGCSARTGSGFVPGSSPAARALRAADSLHVRSLAPGVLYLRAWEHEGPWAIHVLEIDTALCAPAWQARKPPGTLDQRATTSTLARDALAAINADFFQLPGGMPVGVQVHEQRILIGPADRPAWLWDGRRMATGIARIVGVLAAGDDSVALLQVNRPANATSAYRPPRRGATLFASRAARLPPPDSGADLVVLSLTQGDETAGTGLVRQVLRAASDTTALAEGEVSLLLFGPDRAWARRRHTGQQVEWHARVTPAGEDWSAVEAVGGFPVLLRDGRDVLSETEVRPAFGAQRHPRSAIGWSHTSGRVFLVLVDGRQAPFSDGMSLPELTTFFGRLGATDALNLDGGGSSALVVRGQVQNRPSDREGERAVGNALVLAGCQSGVMRSSSRQ